ncbi:proline/glycine betaine ABC transporter permease [Ameyamaea chiangmaiensis NBRC 103196]|uniref:Choline ABC transporter permease subunit n=2 Tax=Ameyamaea chiangmaiensis TaxID=442969 RepID=A0A850P8P3_9PROT|nr:choline ABC transporter permease subunit [Ameyamaea chiangmaiensis]NVN40985.1 choline ABC transporter permease subunit [Ameyamaea chiangmaiensis]GBQ66957.1 proline/glycine betaine ABC transporter permease [Ameyamaea chiangmaiensis NBRC 103196]
MMAPEHWITAHKIPVGTAMAAVIDVVRHYGLGVFDAISDVVGACADGLTIMLLDIPPLLLVAVAIVGAWFLRRSWKLVALIALGLLFIINQGYWNETMATLSLILFSTLCCMVVGVPLGVVSAHRPRLAQVLHPILDLMQTLPTFVYLIPTLILFGLGTVPGMISTIIFAVPAPIRMTQMGIARVPRSLIEAGEAFGATERQILWKIELPAALPLIQAGLTQCIMLSLSMVVIAALVGAGGLGVPVVRALNTVQVDVGFESGFVIVLLAIMLDRLCRSKEPAQ